MNMWHDIDPGTEDAMNVIIETPRGSHNKYEIDKDTGLIKLDRVNYNASPYPFEYGFVPQTYSEDGDALDVMLLTTFPLDPGILVVVRPVAYMLMVDSGEVDNKILGVPADDRRWDDVKDVADVNKHALKEFKNFFETLKLLKEKPGIITIEGFKPAADAKKAFAEAKKMYREKFAK
jgi:inorganic pyrophosphatase